MVKMVLAFMFCLILRFLANLRILDQPFLRIYRTSVFGKKLRNFVMIS